MNLLLDTHVFLWFIRRDRRLPDPWRAAIKDANNSVNLSVVSTWEIIVKNQRGNLPLPAPPGAYISAKRNLHRISSLPLDDQSVARLEGLPMLHRDPFDRMLICQALAHGLTLVTDDSSILAYPIATLP